MSYIAFPAIGAAFRKEDINFPSMRFRLTASHELLMPKTAFEVFETLRNIRLVTEIRVNVANVTDPVLYAMFSNIISSVRLPLHMVSIYDKLKEIKNFEKRLQNYVSFVRKQEAVDAISNQEGSNPETDLIKQSDQFTITDKERIAQAARIDSLQRNVASMEEVLHEEDYVDMAGITATFVTHNIQPGQLKDDYLRFEQIVNKQLS